jgi:hypothetical protein
MEWPTYDRGCSSYISLPQHGTHQISDWKQVYFWKDQWIQGMAVRDVAPLVLQLVNTRNHNRRTVEAAMQDNNWLLDISEPMSQEAAIQSLHLWIRVSNLPRNPLGGQVCLALVLGPPIFCQLCYWLLQEGATFFDAAEAIWDNGAPLKCKIFAWLAVQHRLLTSDRRWRHGLQDHDDLLCVSTGGGQGRTHTHTMCAREGGLGSVTVQAEHCNSCPHMNRVQTGVLVACG